MPEKKKTAAAAPAVEAPAAEAKESKTRKSAKAPARRGRPPLAPVLFKHIFVNFYQCRSAASSIT